MNFSILVYFFWLIIVAVLFGCIGYKIFPDTAMIMAPWILVTFFIFPFAYILSSKKDIHGVEDISGVTSTELNRLKEKVIFSKRFLLAIAITTVIFAVTTGVLIYYSSISGYSIKRTFSVIMSMIGINLYLVYTLWNLNSSINSYITAVKNRMVEMKRKRSLQDRL